MNQYIEDRIIFTYVGAITHIVAAIVPLTWYHAMTEYTAYPSIGLLLICATMGLLPDIDTKASTLGRVVPEISGPLEHHFGHRTITHSIIAVITVAIVVIIIEQFSGYNDWIVITAAYSSHLVVDMIVGGGMGIKLFYPFTLPASLGKIQTTSTAEVVFMYVIIVLAIIPLLIPVVAQSVDDIIPVAPTATPRPLIILTPEATPVIIQISNVDLEDIIVEAGQIIVEQHVQPTDSWIEYHDNVNEARANMNLAESEATREAAPPSAQQINEVCNKIPPLELRVVSEMNAICEQRDTTIAQQELNAAQVAESAAQANYNLAYAPPSSIEISEICNNALSTTVEQQRVAAAKLSLQQLQQPIPESTKQAACNITRLENERDQLQLKLNNLMAPVPLATKEYACDTVQLVYQRDQSQQSLDDLLAPVPIATKEYACNTVQLEAIRDSRRYRLEQLSGSVPKPTRDACWQKIYKLRNDLHSSQLSRDYQIASNPEADWNTLQQPLLAMEGTIEYETSLCQKQDAVESVGEPHEVAEAGSQLMIAQSKLDQQVNECNTWALKEVVGEQSDIANARINVQNAQADLDEQVSKCNEWSSKSFVGTQLEINQTRIDIQLKESLLYDQLKVCETISAIVTTGDQQQIVLAKAALSSAEIDLTSAQLNITNQQNACKAISNKEHSVTAAELTAIDANLQATKSRVSVARAKLDDIINGNNKSAVECAALNPGANGDSPSERVTRVRLLQLEIQQHSEQCHAIRNKPHNSDEYSMAVAQNKLEVARVAYTSSLSTPTPVITWTPIPTPTSTPFPSDTPTVTYTPSTTPTSTPHVLDGVISQIAGTVVDVKLSNMTDNNASIEIHVVPKELPGVSSIIPEVKSAQSSGAISTLFTKTGTDVEAELIKHINAAYTSIDVALFELNLTKVAQAIIEAKARGVAVRVVTDDEHGREKDLKLGHGQFAMLDEANIEVKDDNRGALMHNKFWIFDSQRVWTGSTNITSNGTQRNNNNVLIMDGPAIVQVYQREFDEMWDGKFGSRSPSQQRDQTIELSGVPIEVMFGPEDSTIGRLSGLILSAQQEVKFMAFSFTHDTIGDAMVEVHRRNVNVSGIFEQRASETVYSELPAMYCEHNIDVRVDGNPNTMHHKVIILDRQIVITGSFNFSQNAANNNDENMVAIWSPEIAAMYLAEFDRLWKEGKATNYNCNKYKK